MDYKNKSKNPNHNNFILKQVFIIYLNIYGFKLYIKYKYNI